MTRRSTISWSLEAARFGFKIFRPLWNLAGTSAAPLPRCLSNFRAIRPLQHPISRLRDFTRFGGKTSYHLVNRGPGTSSHVYLAMSWTSWQVWWWYINALGSYTDRLVITRSVFFYTHFNHPMIPPHHCVRAGKVGTHQGCNKHKLLIQCLNISTTRISNKWVRIP